MKKFCISILVLLAMCSKSFASIPTYNTITPINLTINSFEHMTPARKALFTEAMRHFAVAIHEMTNGAHQLGRIKVIQRGTLSNREFMHINWEERFPDFSGNPWAAVLRVGSYIPYTQNTRSVRGSIRIDHGFLDRAIDGPLEAGYTLAHEAGHFIYGLFDEYGEAGLLPPLISQIFFGLYRPDLHLPWDRLADNFHSIMAEHMRFAFSSDTIIRARGLNFSTIYHYGMGNPRYQTAHHRMYPFRTSGWDTLVSNEAPRRWAPGHSRSQFLDLKRYHPRELGYTHPGMVLTHSSFPVQGASEGAFRRLSPVAMDNLQIEWGTTDNQRARLFLVGGQFFEDTNPPNAPWLNHRTDVTALLLSEVQAAIAMMPQGTHIGVYAIGRNGMSPVLGLQRSALSSIDYADWNAITNAIIGFNGTDIPLYDFIYEAISKLQAYMDPKCREQSCTTPSCRNPEHVANVILGDIVVLLGRQTPDVSASSSRNRSWEDVRRKSREHFIPISIEGFLIHDMDDYRLLARKTGGESRKAIVSLTPETFSFVNNLAIRHMALGPEFLLNPWDQHMVHVTSGHLGSFTGRSRSLSAADDLQFSEIYSTLWFSSDFVHAEIEFPTSYQSIAPMQSSPVISSNPFRLDRAFGSFLFSFSIQNLYLLQDIEIALVGPSGVRYPVEINWTYVNRRYGYGVARIPASPGAWRIESIGAEANEIQITYAVVAESRGLFEDENPLGRALAERPYKGAIFTHIDVANVRGGMYDRANGGELFVTVTTYEGRYPLTNLSVTLNVSYPDGRSSSITLNDRGVWPDAVESDGVFTGILRVGHIPEGQVILTANVSNPRGTATPTRLMDAGRINDFDLDGESPFWGDLITERFYRRAQKAFDVRGTVPIDAPPLPDFETVTLPLVNVGQISGLTYLLPGIEIELNVGIYPEDMAEPLAEHLSWSMPLSRHPNLTISPDSQGRPNVVRVLFHETGYGSSEWLQFDSTTPRALRGLMESQTRTHRLILSQPLFIGAGFNNRTKEITILEGEEAFYNMELSLPPGYDDGASWSMTANPDNAGEIVSQRADGVTFRTLRPGRFTMTLTSDVWPQLINRSVEVHSVFREQPGSQPGRPGDDAFGPNPIPGRPDPGGDDDVRTRPDTGNDGGNGGGPSRDPEYQDPQDPVLLPPELSRITLGGRDITDDGVRLIRQWETVHLVLEFRESIDRYMLSAALMAGTNPPHDATSATSTIDNIALSEDGKTLSYEFMGKVPGQHRVFFNVERKDGIEAAGSFVLHVQPSPNLGGQGGPEEGEQGNEGSGGGGCNAGAGALAAMLVLAAAVWKIRKS